MRTLILGFVVFCVGCSDEDLSVAEHSIVDVVECDLDAGTDAEASIPVMASTVKVP
jgi:hypothetical protein